MSFEELKELCNDHRVPQRTRKISYNLFRTSPVVAIEYIKGWPYRKAVEDHLK